LKFCPIRTWQNTSNHEEGVLEWHARGCGKAQKAMKRSTHQRKWGRIWEKIEKRFSNPWAGRKLVMGEETKWEMLNYM
jgi:hypothetical protein